MTGKASIRFSNADQFKGNLVAGLYDGKSTFSYANGATETTKFNRQIRVEKATMTTVSGQSLSGTIGTSGTNTLSPSKGFNLLLPPVWPILPMPLDTESSRIRK